MELIDKIRAEVEKKTHREQGYRTEDAEYGYRDCASEILSFLDTLETKEVDFIKEFYTFSEKHKLMDKDIEFSDIEKTASFFFQLGLKTQKGE